MVVVMLIRRQMAHATLAEQRDIAWVDLHIQRMAGATDMMVKTHHPIGRRHHHVQIMADHEDATIPTSTGLLDQAHQLILAMDVEALGRLVHHQEVRVPQQCPGEQNPLGLTAGQRPHGPVGKRADPDFLKHLAALSGRHRTTKRQEASHRQGKCCVKLQLLWHVADPQPGPRGDLALVGAKQVQEHPQQQGFTGAVRADQADHLAGHDGDLDSVEHGLATPAHGHAVAFDQRVGHCGAGAGAQDGQRPRTSSVVSAI